MHSRPGCRLSLVARIVRRTDYIVERTEVSLQRKVAAGISLGLADLVGEKEPGSKAGGCHPASCPSFFMLIRQRGIRHRTAKSANVPYKIPTPDTTPTSSALHASPPPSSSGERDHRTKLTLLVAVVSCPNPTVVSRRIPPSACFFLSPTRTNAIIHSLMRNG